MVAHAAVGRWVAKKVEKAAVEATVGEQATSAELTKHLLDEASQHNESSPFVLVT